MTERKDLCRTYEYFYNLFKKLYENAYEAYARTPLSVSSRPYIERVLRLAQSGLSISLQEYARYCKSNESS